jgi:glycogen synthase
MRIIMWSDAFWPTVGGTEMMVGNLIIALKKAGHELMVITANSKQTPPVWEYEGVPVYRFRFNRMLENRDLKQIGEIVSRIAELKREFKPDVVHYHSGLAETSAFYHLHTRQAHPSPTVMTIHAMYTPYLQPQTLLGRMARTSNWVTAVSATTLAETRTLAPEIKAHSSTIYNGLPIPALEPTLLQFSPPRLLCVGRTVKEKGFDLAIVAMTQIRQKFPEARLIIAGEGEARPALEAKVAELGLGEAVEFLGLVDPTEIPALINTASLVIMPSRWSEPFGLSALQAAQMARPIVATRIGGLPEVVAEGETGLLFKQDDSAALADSILYMLEHPVEAQRMGEAARKRAREKFSLDATVSAYETLYRRLIAQAQN